MKQIITYLKELQQNNNRDWFHQNRKQYETARSQFESFVDALIFDLGQMDNSLKNLQAKDCIFRINRDVRFSKNKEPYKLNFGAHIALGGRKSERGGYYIHIQPGGESFAGGGIYMPQAEVLKKIRKEITWNTDSYKRIINDNLFVKTFGCIYGEKLKTRPKGFDDFTEPELIRNKHYAVVHKFTDKEVLSEEFFKHVMSTFNQLKPLNDFLNKALDI